MSAFDVTGPHLRRAANCEPILRALPDWFGIESAIVQYVKDIEELPTFVASSSGDVVGFLTVRRHFDPSAEIHVIAVRREFHRAGVGRALVRAAEAWLRDQGVEFLQVKTLSPSRLDVNYERTRAFYVALGFRPLEEFKTLWGERNPCLQMVKSIKRHTEASAS